MHRILISRKGSHHVLWSEFSFSHITKIWVRKCLSWKKFSLLCCQNLLFYLWIKFARYLCITFSPLTPLPKFSCEWILRFGGHFFELKRYTPLGKHHGGGWVVLGRTHVLYVFDIFLEENRKVNICAFCMWQSFWRAASAFSPQLINI